MNRMGFLLPRLPQYFQVSLHMQRGTTQLKSPERFFHFYILGITNEVFKRTVSTCDCNANFAIALCFC